MNFLTEHTQKRANSCISICELPEQNPLLLFSKEALELTDVPFASVDNKSSLFFHVWAVFI